MSFGGAVWLVVQEDLYRGFSSGYDHKNSSSSRSNISSSSNSSSTEESRGILGRMDDYFLSQCFHSSRACLAFLIDYVTSRLQKDVFRPVSDSASVEAMILATLHFCSHGFLPKKITDLLGLDQLAAAEGVNLIFKVLADMSHSFITFPGSYDDRMGVAQGFKNISGIPNVVGVLGCLHVRVTPPPTTTTTTTTESLYLNPLGYNSVMMQIISDVDGNLLSVEQCCPGGTLEKTVWEKSNIYQEFINFQHGQTWLVGGKGLPQSRHMLTPVQRTQSKTSAAERFNAAHSALLSSNQHVIGCLKTRFQCLHGLGAVQANKLEPFSRIITACCVLHNIYKKFSVPLPREPVLEPLPPVQVRKEGEEKSFCYMGETQEDMIEMCFGNDGD
ncbi:putative nuclease HARBI1 [Astyanax mexicanus]|uniref:Putative nuclease HARBI1 n=1 Tax=Astyanax mexicanus TaxID=7994 RepID=A0A8T2MSH8_ASTMX|nr:putative nuclease HARBI1 [Astyanax mexicanus]